VLAQYGSLYSPGSIRTCIGPAHEANTRKYWLVEVIENDCIITQVGVYDEISPEPSGKPLFHFIPILSSQNIYILTYLTMEYWKIAVAIFPSRQSVFHSELLKLPWQSPQIGNTRKYSSSRAGPIRVRVLPRENMDPYWVSSWSQYKKILQAHGVGVTMEYWKIAVAIFPSRQSVFPSELLKLPWQSPQIGNTRKYSSSRAGSIRVRILPREYTDPYWASSWSQYEKILQAHGVNTRKYWLVEEIENDCIVTRVGVYD